MNDELLFERLARHDGPAAPDSDFETRLYAVLRQDLGRQPVTGLWGMSRSLAIALALVALLIITIGLAVAGGLLRIDRPDPDDVNPFALAGPTSRCEATLAEGLVLNVRGYGAGETWEDASELNAYEDGLVVIGPSALMGGSFNTLDTTWSQRRLTADGVAHLADAVTGSLPSCQTFASQRYMAIQARSGGEVFVITLGASHFETRVTTPDQAAAVDALVERLHDPELGLLAADWAEPEWHAYVPEQWRFSLQFSGRSASQDPPDYPLADDVVLPDGSTLETFGIEEPTEGLDPSTSGVAVLRCAFVEAEEARAIAAILTDAGGRLLDASAFGWSFSTDAVVADGTLWVMAAGLLPHEHQQMCLTAIVGPAMSPTPEPAPFASATGAAPFADACEYLPSSLVAEVIAPHGAADHMPDWNADWSMCWQPLVGDGLVVFATHRSIPAEHASEQATSVFGEGGFRVEQIGGHTVFVSTCDPSAGTCRAAIAISAEPHFVVIVWRSEAELRQLVEGLIQLLDAQ